MNKKSEIIPISIIAINIIISILTLMCVNGIFGLSCDLFDCKDSDVSWLVVAIMPLASIALYLLLSFFQTHPDKMAYSFHFVSADMAYKMLSQCVWQVKNIVAVMMLFVSVCILPDAESAINVGMPVFLLVIIAVVSSYLVRLAKA